MVFTKEHILRKHQEEVNVFDEIVILEAGEGRGLSFNRDGSTILPYMIGVPYLGQVDKFLALQKIRRWRG